jgi:anti-sigma-K factor RskA
MIPRHEDDQDRDNSLGFWGWVLVAAAVVPAIAGLVYLIYRVLS